MAGKPGRPRKNPEPQEQVTSEQVEAWASKTQEPHPSDLSVGDRDASREARSETRHGFGRKERKPIGSAEPRTSFKVPSGMTGRRVTDDPGRIQLFLDAGYQFVGGDGEIVQDREGADTVNVGVSRYGGAQTGYAMALPTVLYEQDQAQKQGRIDEIDTAIRRGEPRQTTAQDQRAFYTPDAGINYRPNTSAER